MEARSRTLLYIAIIGFVLVGLNIGTRFTLFLITLNIPASLLWSLPFPLTLIDFLIVLGVAFVSIATFFHYSNNQMSIRSVLLFLITGVILLIVGLFIIAMPLFAAGGGLIVGAAAGIGWHLRNRSTTNP